MQKNVAEPWTFHNGEDLIFDRTTSLEFFSSANNNNYAKISHLSFTHRNNHNSFSQHSWIRFRLFEDEESEIHDYNFKSVRQSQPPTLDCRRGTYSEYTTAIPEVWEEDNSYPPKRDAPQSSLPVVLVERELSSCTAWHSKPRNSFVGMLDLKAIVVEERSQVLLQLLSAPGQVFTLYIRSAYYDKCLFHSDQLYVQISINKLTCTLCIIEHT